METVIKPIYKWPRDSLILVLHSKILLFANYGNGEAICKETLWLQIIYFEPGFLEICKCARSNITLWQYEETSRNQFTGSRRSFQRSRYASLKKRCCSLKRKGFYSLEKGCFWRNRYFDNFSFIHLRRNSLEYLTT